MNLDDAIRAHSDWKIKLVTYFRKPDGSIDPKTLGRDDACVLGQWINKEAPGRTSDQKFLELKREHTSFHVQAAELVKRANADEDVVADMVLGSTSSYAKVSKRVIQLLMGLKEAEVRASRKR